MHTWIDIATIVKKKSAQGRFVVRCRANLLLCLKPGMRIAFVPPVLDAPRNARIVDVTKTDDTTAHVVFEYEDGPWDAVAEDRLVGLHCLALRDELEEEQVSSLNEPLIGFEVVDSHTGLVGTIQEIVEYPHQQLLAVARADTSSGVLIPYVDAFVLKIDEDAHTIFVDLPQGLLEL